MVSIHGHQSKQYEKALKVGILDADNIPASFADIFAV